MYICNIIVVLSGLHTSSVKFYTDVTTAHNFRATDRGSLLGCAAEAPKLMPDDEQFLFFSLETFGFIHRMAKDFLKRLFSSSNDCWSSITNPCFFIACSPPGLSLDIDQ